MKQQEQQVGVWQGDHTNRGGREKKLVVKNSQKKGI
jgi:hypothetical protein